MALGSTGAISLGGDVTGQSINLELSQTATATISLNDVNVRTLAGVPSGVISMPADFWGKSSVPVGTAYWAAYAGYQLRPSPAASFGYYDTYNNDQGLFNMISSTGNLITIGNRRAYAQPKPSSDVDIHWRKFNSAGVYQSQYSWGNNFPNRNGMTLQAVHLNKTRTSMACIFNSGNGNPLGAPIVRTIMDENFNRTTAAEARMQPTTLTTVAFSSAASYAPNGKMLWIGSGQPSPTSNFGYGIINGSDTTMTLYRLPNQTGATNLNHGFTAGVSSGAGADVTSDPSSNFYALTKADSATTAYNWWKFNSSGGVIGQLTTSNIGYSGQVSADANDSGTSFIVMGTGSGGFPVFAINSGGTVLWSTLITEAGTGGGTLYVRFDQTNNKVILFAQYNAHSVDGCVIYIIWLNPATGDITMQRKLTGHTSTSAYNKPDVFLDRILFTVKTGTYNTGVNRPAPTGGAQLVINPNNVISLPAPGGAIGTAVGYQNTLTYSVTTRFSNSPFSVTLSPNGLAGFVSPGGGHSAHGLNPTNYDYPSEINTSGSWNN